MKAGWEVRRLLEVTTKIGSGATPRGGNVSYKQEGLSLIRSLNVHDLDFRTKDLALIDDTQAEALSNVVVEPRDVLLNITGASIARCAVVPEEVLPARVNQHVSIIRPMPQKVDSNFLAYLLVSKDVKGRLLGIGDEGGSTRQALTKAQLQEFPIPLPPLEEQQRIVAVLDEAFEGLTRARAHAEANLQNARELFSNYAATVFRPSGVDSEAKASTTIGSVCKIQSGSGFPLQYQGKTEGAYPFYKVSDMNLSGNEWELRTANNYVSEDVRRELGAKVFPKGSIVFPKVGGAIATNKKRVVEQAGCVDNNVMGLMPDEHAILPAYLHEWLRAFDIYEFSNKANPPSITQSTVANWPLRVPSLDEQQDVVTMAETLREQSEQLRAHYRTKLQSIDALRQSLLQKAFAGELT